MPPAGPATEAAEAQAERLAAAVSPATTPAPPAAASVDPPIDGAALPDALRAHYEPRFGRSLAGLRLHSGPRAAAQAHSVGAHAYTIDQHIVLGRDRAPRASRTLAHEIAHALHHPRGVAWREPYETRGIALDRSQINTLSDRGYWTQRTLNSFATTTDTRMSADPEERDAVLAVLWSLPPPTRVTRRQELVVPIAARTLPAPPAAVGAGTGSGSGGAAPAPPPTTSELVYRFIFEPPARGQTLPRLTMQFVASGTGMSPLAAAAAPAAFTPSTPRAWSSINFPPPSRDMMGYFAQHPQEHAALFHWIENSAAATFSQLVTTTSMSTGRTPRVTHRSAIHVAGSHTGSNIASLTARLVSQTEVMAQQAPAANYRGRGDALDAHFERFRARATDALGTVALPTGLPADEVVPVKEAVRQYFDAGRARNTEVDAIVPVGTGSRTAMFTLIFGASNDVTVRRVGEAGTPTAAAPGLVDVSRIDLRRVRGFPAGGTPAQLRTWWTTRYPGAPTLQSPTTADAAAVLTEMNGLVASGVSAAGWFNTVYGIEILDAAALSARLQTTHSVPARLLRDTIAFDSTDLRMLELALQTLSARSLAALRGTRLGRKTTSFRSAGRGFAAGGTGQYGLTLRRGSDVTVVYFAPLYANNDRLLTGGGAATALPQVTMNLLHELGHVTEGQAGVEAAFNAFVAATPQAAPTWYAATRGGHELFPESWALYHTDPRFLCGSAPALYAWLDLLATTGAPPAAGATLTAPASCPH